MALEDKVAQLSQNVGNLVNLVSTQANNWNNAVQNKINELEQWKQNAVKGYPAWNLFANPRLDKVNSDGSPKGVWYENYNGSITSTVMNDSGGGNFLRLQVSVANQNTNFNGVYCSLGIYPTNHPVFPSNAPRQKITAGFEYRVINRSGNCFVIVGSDADGLYIDNPTATSWTAVSQTLISGKYALAYIYLNEPSATLTIDLRNIFLNLGDANYYTLGIPQLTDLNV
jgi:hypothetical protein